MNRFDLKKLQDFDSSEWSRFETEFFSRIYFYVKKQVKDHQAAEDIAQETFLGAVRGIEGFDTQYSYEQFLFGIARNRVVDYFRKKRPIPISEKEDSGMSRSYMGLERMASPRRAPDESAIAFEDMRAREKVLTDILRTFVAQLWEEGEFEKLKILEFLFALGGRNKEAADQFDVRDEKAVAGIKFRALERLRGLARQADPDHLLFEGLWKPGAR